MSGEGRKMRSEEKLRKGERERIPGETKTKKRPPYFKVRRDDQAGEKSPRRHQNLKVLPA